METQPETQGEQAPRLTLRGVARDFLERFLSLDRGWLRTARELTATPGKMIGRYVEGHRRDYANPFAYLMVTTAVNFGAQTLLGYQERMVAGVQLASGQTPAQAAFIDQMTEVLFANMLYVAFAMFIPIALLLRLFFLRSGRNLAEALVFTLYCGGHLALLGIPLLVATFFVRPGGLVHSASGLLLAIAYSVWAAGGFFGGGWFLRVLKVAAAYLVSYAFLMTVTVIGTIVWVVIVGLGPGHAIGEDWNLITATERNSIRAVMTLLEEGADPDLISERTALHIAVENGQAELVDLLLAHGADVDARDHLGRSPLFLAVARKWPELARTLREAGADATSVTEDGSSLLLIAVRRGDMDTALWTLDNGVDVNAERDGADRATALMMAAAKGKLEMVELLLARGADPLVTNEDGKTALDLARGAEIKIRIREAMPDADH